MFPATPRRASIPRTTRRSFLIGAAATGLLAACSSDDDGEGSDGTTGSGDGSGSKATEGTLEPGAVGVYTLVQRFPQGVQVPGEIRLPFSLSTGAAELVQDGPTTLGAQVIDTAGNPVGERITAARRDVAPAPYYAFRPVVEEMGFYPLLVDGGPPEGAAVQVADPAEVPVPKPGDLLVGIDTPTTGDAAGVDPICTRTPEVCQFHTIPLLDALNVGQPVVYYVGTPAFCSTGSCGPALESMIELHPTYGDRMTFIHAEVFTDTTATQVTAAVEATGMFYEPALFVTDADGVVVERLDGLWDTTELNEVLDRALA